MLNILLSGVHLDALYDLVISLHNFSAGMEVNCIEELSNLNDRESLLDPYGQATILSVLTWTKACLIDEGLREMWLSDAFKKVRTPVYDVRNFVWYYFHSCTVTAPASTHALVNVLIGCFLRYLLNPPPFPSPLAAGGLDWLRISIH